MHARVHASMASDLISGIYVQISGMACLHPGFLTRRKKLGLLQIKGGVEPTTNWRLQFDSRLKGIGASSTLVAATAKLMHMLDRDSGTTYACMHCREGHVVCLPGAMPPAGATCAVPPPATSTSGANTAGAAPSGRPTTMDQGGHGRAPGRVLTGHALAPARPRSQSTWGLMQGAARGACGHTGDSDGCCHKLMATSTPPSRCPLRLRTSSTLLLLRLPLRRYCIHG